eukprot:15439303-Alexandrium_andersonii.AAC.1
MVTFRVLAMMCTGAWGNADVTSGTGATVNCEVLELGAWLREVGPGELEAHGSVLHAETGEVVPELVDVPGESGLGGDVAGSLGMGALQ